MLQIEFNAQEIEEALPKYRYLSQLGCGTFASVHLVSHRQTNQQVALKKISCFGMGEYEKAGATNEVRILGSLDHKNIIKVHSCLFDNNEDILYIFLEYACNGDLTVLIDQARQRKKRIPENTIWKALADISDGLQYLHKHQIIHRDIKPANIFRGDQCFKIGDMNVSKVIKAGSLATTKTGSPLYTAPEVWESEHYDEKCDLWSLGVLIYELCALKVPFQADSIEELNRKIKATSKNKSIPSSYSSQLNDLVRKMLEVNPKKRISAELVHKMALDKLRIETQGESTVEQLMETIVFPQSHQRWVNLIPLPPKTCKKQSAPTTIKRSSSKQKSRCFTGRKKSEESVIENNSNIFVSQRPKIPRTKSRSKNITEHNLPPTSNRLPPVRLPSINKRTGSSIERQPRESSVTRNISRSKSKDKEVTDKTRDSSSSARINRKMVQKYLKSAKQLINQ